jgi:hypothetical protein
MAFACGKHLPTLFQRNEPSTNEMNGLSEHIVSNQKFYYKSSPYNGRGRAHPLPKISVETYEKLGIEWLH